MFPAQAHISKIRGWGLNLQKGERQSSVHEFKWVLLAFTILNIERRQT
jgi:hypothetical protein